MFISLLVLWYAVVVAHMARTLKQFARAWIYCAVATVLGLIVYAVLAPLAYLERGYFAFGGEALVAIAVAAIAAPLLIVRDAKICAWIKKRIK